MKTTIGELMEERRDVLRWHFLHAPYPRELIDLTLQIGSAQVVVIAFEQFGEREPAFLNLEILFRCLKLDSAVRGPRFLFHGHMRGWPLPHNDSYCVIQGYVDGFRRGMFFIPERYDMWLIEPPCDEYM